MLSLGNRDLKLNLSSCGLNRLPKFIASVSLEWAHINFAFNDFKQLPDMRAYTKLRHLNLRYKTSV